MNRLFFYIFLAASGLALLFVALSWHLTNKEIARFSVLSNSAMDWPLGWRDRSGKPRARAVKGLYLTAYSAGNPKKLNEIIDLIDRTELNAVVIDIKDYSGYVLYDSRVPLVVELGLKNNRLGDVRALIRKLHAHRIYVIARQTVFQDPLLAEKRTAWATKNADSSVWRDRKGLAWVDPTKREVWQYNLALAKEAIKLGFDEINFDYVRFPSDGRIGLAVYADKQKIQTEIMRDFYKFLGTGLLLEPAWTSFDFFGFTLERHDGMGIGQRLADAVGEADYISPMMYPSHYPRGHMGFKNPADYPELVIAHGLEKGLPYFDHTRAKLRPWIQAFNLGAVYDGAKIRTEIDTVERYAGDGWMLWNAGNRYTAAGLKPKVKE